MVRNKKKSQRFFCIINEKHHFILQVLKHLDSYDIIVQINNTSFDLTNSR